MEEPSPQESFSSEAEYMDYLRRNFGVGYSFRSPKSKRASVDSKDSPPKAKKRVQTKSKQEASLSDKSEQESNQQPTSSVHIVIKSASLSSEPAVNSPLQKLNGKRSLSSSPPMSKITGKSATKIEPQMHFTDDLEGNTQIKQSPHSLSPASKPKSVRKMSVIISEAESSNILAKPSNRNVSPIDSPQSPSTPKPTKTVIPSRPKKDTPVTPTYIQQGKFYGILPSSRKQRILRMPIFDGADLLTKVSDFKLPYEIWKEMKMSSLEEAISKTNQGARDKVSKTAPVKMLTDTPTSGTLNLIENVPPKSESKVEYLSKADIPHFDMLFRNYYPHGTRPKVNREDILVCNCKVDYTKKVGCLDSCVNRCLFFECHRSLCPCGEYCQNQNFQRRKYAKTRVIKTDGKGYGLVCVEDLKAGQFVIEYCGEVISDDECRGRLQDYQLKGESNFYFLTLGSNLVVDASMKGNNARFINHSCTPNCETQKWTVNGEIVVGLFALRDIPKGTELTFDYQFERVGAGRQVCRCGAQECRGYIGSKTNPDAEKKNKKLPPEEDPEKTKKRSPYLIARIERRHRLLAVLERKMVPQKTAAKRFNPVFLQRTYRRGRITRLVQFERWISMIEAAAKLTAK